MKTAIKCLEAKGLPPQKKFTLPSTEKQCYFFDSNGFILQKWVPVKQSVNGECYAKTALWNAIWGK